MKKKVVLVVIGSLALIVSLVWGITQESFLEPWTAVLSALLCLVGILLPADSSSPSTDISQSNTMGFFNSSIIKRTVGKIRQMNFLSIGNKQEIDNRDIDQS